MKQNIDSAYFELCKYECSKYYFCFFQYLWGHKWDTVIKITEINLTGGSDHKFLSGHVGHGG